MIRYATLEEAKQAALEWKGVPSSVLHLGDRGNSVFSFLTETGESQILRFTDPDFRTHSEVLAELHFVNHLCDSHVKVASAVKRMDGSLTYEAGPLICSAVTSAPGEEVLGGSPLWNRTYFIEWGRNLAAIHKNSVGYKPIEGQRWRWDDEILVARADVLIPPDDEKSREEFHEVIHRCRALEVTAENFGLIHADHAPQNFRFDPHTQKITAFDFGNCCYHWYAADLAISLSTVRRQKNRDEIRECLFEGYSELMDLPPDLGDLIDLFIRLRVLYVYLSRLHLWSHQPTAEQTRDLKAYRDLVHKRAGWNI